VCADGGLFADNSQSAPVVTRADELVINTLRQSDANFKALRQQIETTKESIYSSPGEQKQSAWPGLAATLKIYRYKVEKGVDYLDICASLNLGKEALITLNHLDSAADVFPGKTLLLPSVPCLYIPESPRTDIEKLLSTSRTGGAPVTVEGEHFSLYPGAGFNQNELTFFINAGMFTFPLKKFTLTSSFGMRTNPVSGHYLMHNGLDLAAPAGTPIYPAREGKVTKIVRLDPIYGNYVIISHDNGWSSLYGHMSKILTTLNSFVTCATIIGEVGSTGQSTGPHLHFSLFKNGTAENPSDYLQKR
jgi:murein DD-endopeptidase MepM/ murein hydrolase activator NlpD